MTLAEPMLINFHDESQEDRQKWLYLQNAMELTLSLGDFHKIANQPYDKATFCELVLAKVEQIVRFEASAIWTVVPDTSDLNLAAYHPADRQHEVEKEVDFLINQGAVAWAIREKRGITIFSQDGSRQLLLHVIATYARIRGLFVGIFPSRAPRLPDGALEIISMMLRSAATTLESIEYIELLNRKNKELEQQVAAKMKLLIHRERELSNTRKMNAIGALAGGIAHEFNNALAGLFGYNELLTMACQGNTKLLGYLDKAKPLLERMALLTQQLLSYSRGGKYQSKVIGMKSLVEDSLANIRGQLGPNTVVEVTCQSAEDSITADLMQMRRAISAVLVNADEAIDGNGTIRINVGRTSHERIPVENISGIEAGDYIYLEISDNGCGMDQETRERVFEPFFSTKLRGRGLSMAAVQGIVENHKGFIHLESKPGQGTLVRIYLPAV